MRPKLSYFCKVVRDPSLGSSRFRTRREVLLGRTEVLVVASRILRGGIWKRVVAMGWEGDRMVVHVK